MLTLADYVRQTGAEVVTYRAGFSESLLDTLRPDLVLLSPGPDTPRDHGMHALLDALRRRALPAFGVCLGLQGVVEYCGGALERLPRPAHGEAIEVEHDAAGVFAGLPERFAVGRYHSLVATPASLSDERIVVSARASSRLVMGVRAEALGFEGVQFHPESILTPRRYGHRMIANALGAAG